MRLFCLLLLVHLASTEPPSPKREAEPDVGEVTDDNDSTKAVVDSSEETDSEEEADAGNDKPVTQWWREDGKCGVGAKLANGRPAECNPHHPRGYTCCTGEGQCDKPEKHQNCKCKKCVDYTATWRKDSRCGEEFFLPNGHAAECDPFHPQAKSCCSELGWCGSLPKHCSCPECKNYTARWRKDLRCGPMFKLPNGKPAQCDPNNRRGYVCCSKRGWCGKTNAHCKCRGCIKYTSRGPLVFSPGAKRFTKLPVRSASSR